MGIWNRTCQSKARLDGKTTIVTGCNTGIGKHTVQDFYRRGATVIMACRTVEKAEAAAADIQKECEGELNLGKIIIEKLDLTSLASVRDFAKRIQEAVSYIHILVNNAGVMIPPKTVTEDGFELQIGTNHFGPFLLTMLLLPKIIKSQPARIVNVSSLAHTFSRKRINLDDLNWEKRSYSKYEAYYQSKLANILFTKELARRLKDAQIEGVTTYALHPGVIVTDLARHMEDNFLFSFAYRHIFGLFVKSPKQGTQTTIYCSVDNETANETGLYYADCKAKSPSCNAQNMEDAEKLWNVSWAMVGLDKNYDPFVGK